MKKNQDLIEKIAQNWFDYKKSSNYLVFEIAVSQ